MATLGSNFPYTLPPITNITPFSYRDGATYLEILEGLKNYINTNLRGEFNDGFNELLTEFQAGITNAETTITTLSEAWTAEYDAFIANFTDEIRVLNEAAVAGMVTNPSAVRTAALALIDAEIATATTALHTYTDTAVSTATTANHTYTDTAVTTATTAATTANHAYTDTAVAAGDAALNTALRADLETKSAVQLIRNIYPVGNVDVVYIGDSYFSGYQPLPTPYIQPVPEKVTNLLNAQGLNNYVMHNYANNAGGYDTTIGGGDTYFNTQVSAAIEDTSITNCRLIVVGGGRNDAGKDVYDEAVAIYNRLKVKWPKAKLVVFPMWTREKLGSAARRTFDSIYRAAKDVGACYDVNSLWVNAFTPDADWIDTVLHPKDSTANKFAYALYSLIQGGNLPARTTDISVHSSSGVTAGTATLDGWNVTVSLQQYVGANFDSTYILGSMLYPVLYPQGVNQYMVGYSGNGLNLNLYTISAATGEIFLANGSGITGVVGFNGAYPLGM